MERAIKFTPTEYRMPIDSLNKGLLAALGFGQDLAEEITEYANMLTGSNRRVDQEFLEEVQRRGENLEGQGVQVYQETSTRLAGREEFLRRYGPDWQRGTRTQPEGRRRMDPVHLEVKKQIVITKI